MPKPANDCVSHVERHTTTADIVGKACTAGSSGIHQSHPYLRRCGWAAVVVDSEGTPLSTSIGPLPGDKQTSARAGLYADVWVARHVACAWVQLASTPRSRRSRLSARCPGSGMHGATSWPARRPWLSSGSSRRQTQLDEQAGSVAACRCGSGVVGVVVRGGCGVKRG